jgi:hypothetical protein
MLLFAFCSRRILPATALAALLALAAPLATAQDDDPPSEAGRISSISGNVSIQPTGTEEWGQAYANLPIGPGDRIFTDSDGRAEVQVGQTYVRIGPNSDVSLVNDSQFGISFGVAQGSVHLHAFGLGPRQLLDVNTPNGNAEFERAGDLRIDVFPTDGATVFTNYGEFADITAAGDFRQELDNGQSLQLSGSNPVYSQWLQPAPADDLDSWAQQRDQQLSHVAAYSYVSPDIPGAADLDSHGEWQPDTEYGAVWFPRDVPGDWEPYHYGHWINHQPWGWVWVEDESWGYAPFHYGRWVSYGGRWGWIPGPRTVRPVWSPALVVFAGGIRAGGVGVSAWFPLGPGEAYRPWYRCSPRYIDRVNITNISESRRVHVEKTYVNVVNVTNITYINQNRGVTAMRHEDFAAGRSARNANVQVDSHQFDHVRPLATPEPVPTQQSFVPRPVAHPVRVSNQRPMLINQQGQFIAARPGATPVAPPVRPVPPVRTLPGRTIIAAPARVAPGSMQGRPIPPAQGAQPPSSNQPSPYPGGQPRPTPQPPVQPSGRPIPPAQGAQPPNTNQPSPYPGGQPRPTPQPPVQPSGRPIPPAQGAQPPNANQPSPYPGGQPRPTPQPPVQPSGRPVPPPQGGQEVNRPPSAYPGGQPRPTPQPPVQPTQRPTPQPPANNQDRQDRNPGPPPDRRPQAEPPARQAPPPPAARPAPPQDRGNNKPDNKKEDKKKDDKPNQN